MSAFGIYVHWPYCVAKCPYCDFNSHVRPRIDEQRWVKLIQRELNNVATLQNPKPEVTSVFFGGGTPSLMSGRATEVILNTISALWPLDNEAEITLEANPNSVEQARFEAYRAAGVNRVSIGVQSLNDAALQQLGRAHDATEAKQAIRSALAVFPRVSFDLIYARPGQTRRDWAEELQAALAFGTEHLSVYQLTIEQGTAFASLQRQGLLALPEEDAAADLYQLTQDICDGVGLHSYEVSNHARAGQESRHNLIYWRYGDYAGVGPGAHGRFTNSGVRWGMESERLPERWAARIDSGGTAYSLFRIPDADAAREQVLMNMRIKEGLDLASLARRWRMTIPAGCIARLRDLDLIADKETAVMATRKGRLVLNRVISELVGAINPV